MSSIVSAIASSPDRRGGRQLVDRVGRGGTGGPSVHRGAPAGRARVPPRRRRRCADRGSGTGADEPSGRVEQPEIDGPRVHADTARTPSASLAPQSEKDLVIEPKHVPVQSVGQRHRLVAKRWTSVSSSVLGPTRPTTTRPDDAPRSTAAKLPAVPPLTAGTRPRPRRPRGCATRSSGSGRRRPA